VEDAWLIRFGSYDHAWCVHNNVRLTKRGNDAISAGARRSKINEQDLIVVMMDDLGQLCSESDEFTPRQPAFKHGKLKVVSPTPHRFEYFPQPFRVRDVIANDVGIAHGFTLPQSANATP
jgi:hypothetical protein